MIKVALTRNSWDGRFHFEMGDKVEYLERKDSEGKYSKDTVVVEVGSTEAVQLVGLMEQYESSRKILDNWFEVKRAARDGTLEAVNLEMDNQLAESNSQEL